MKLAVYLSGNVRNWKTLDDKLDEVVGYFAPYLDIQIEKVSLSDLPRYQQYTSTDGAQFTGIHENFIKEHLIQADAHLFCFDKNMWKEQFIQGYMRWLGTPVSVLGVAENESVSFPNGKVMNAFVAIGVHELLHGEFKRQGKKDVVHQYYNKGDFNSIFINLYSKNMIYIKHGRVTAPFAGYSKEVAEQVGNQHTGIDEMTKWKAEWYANNSGVAYKVWRDRYPQWQAVHQIVEDETGCYEVLDLGHAIEIFVEEGQMVKEGQPLGLEGNAGEVYANGRQVTFQERLNGSTDGYHNHRGRRPVNKVKNLKAGKYYLETRQGNPYHDGHYYEIIHSDNGAKGWVDPEQFKPKPSRQLEVYVNYLKYKGKTKPILLAIINMLKAFGS